MRDSTYNKELLKCVRCGACKTLCPTYSTTLNESMGARGRIAMLGELDMERFAPTKRLAEKIFGCMLCGACKNLCPAGINIPEIIYQARTALKNSYSKGLLLRTALKFSASRPDTFFFILRWLQRLFYQPLSKTGFVRYIPEITPRPFKKRVQVYKNIKKVSRIAFFAGCSVNYFYPYLGDALFNILLSKGHEVVVFKGENCCGSPFRALGLEQEASELARRNIEHFNKVRAEAIISICPTCTMVIREQYPLLTGDTISNLLDINEFLIKYDIAENLEISPRTVTYHDPCHLSYGLGIKNEPRQILKGIKGVQFTEMDHADECCGFAGLFSLHFKDMSKSISRKKVANISKTSAETVVTSCPGCITQLESVKKEANLNIDIRHIIEVIDEAMHG